MRKSFEEEETWIDRELKDIPSKYIIGQEVETSKKDSKSNAKKSIKSSTSVKEKSQQGGNGNGKKDTMKRLKIKQNGLKSENSGIDAQTNIKKEQFEDVVKPMK